MLQFSGQLVGSAGTYDAFRTDGLFAGSGGGNGRETVKKGLETLGGVSRPIKLGRARKG